MAYQRMKLQVEYCQIHRSKPACCRLTSSILIGARFVNGSSNITNWLEDLAITNISTNLLSPPERDDIDALALGLKLLKAPRKDCGSSSKSANNRDNDIDLGTKLNCGRYLISFGCLKGSTMDLPSKRMDFSALNPP